MATDNEEYTLGEDVTQYALSKKSRDSVVVSVRLSAQDFNRLEKICIDTGKSMSQVVREAVAAYSGPEKPGSRDFKVSMKTSEGMEISFGPTEYSEAPSVSLTAGILGENQASGRV